MAMIASVDFAVNYQIKMARADHLLRVSGMCSFHDFHPTFAPEGKMPFLGEGARESTYSVGWGVNRTVSAPLGYSRCFRSKLAEGWHL